MIKKIQRRSEVGLPISLLKIFLQGNFCSYLPLILIVFFSIQNLNASELIIKDNVLTLDWKQYLQWANQIIDGKKDQLAGKNGLGEWDFKPRSFDIGDAQYVQQGKITLNTFDLKLNRQIKKVSCYGKEATPSSISLGTCVDFLYVVEDETVFRFKLSALATVTPSSLAEGTAGEGDGGGGGGNLELGGSVYFHKIHSAKQVFATLEQAQAASLLPLLLPHIFLSESGFTLIRPGMEINLDNKIEIIGKAGFQWTGPYAITVGASASGQWINTSTKTLIFDQLGKSVIYSYGRHNLVGLNLEAQVGIGFFNLVDLELVKLGASASMQVGKLGHFHFPIKATTNEELELELKEIGPLVALANADPNNAITLPYQKHEFIGSTEFVKMFNTSFYFRFFIFQWSTGESVEQRDLVYRSPSSENVQTDGDVQLESEEGNALTKRSFYSHTKQKEFKIRGIFSMFKGTMMSVADMLFTMFTGIPYATAQRSMLNYESQSNIILNGRPLELKNKSSFSYNFVHNHQSSKKGLWKILSRAKLKGLFKRYDLNGSGSAPNWQKVLGMATTPWNFTNSVSIGVGAVEFILKHQEEDVLLKVEQACQSVSCSDSELDKLLDGMKEFIGKTYHRIANENDKSVCHLRVKEQMKGHNVFWRLANKGKLIRQCFKDLTKIDPELRKFNIAAPELWNWFDQTQELKNRGQFLVNIFGNQNIQWESKLFYTISGMPFILSTARAGAQIPSPIEDAVNNLR